MTGSSPLFGDPHSIKRKVWTIGAGLLLGFLEAVLVRYLLTMLHLGKGDEPYVMVPPVLLQPFLLLSLVRNKSLAWYSWVPNITYGLFVFGFSPNALFFPFLGMGCVISSVMAFLLIFLVSLKK